MQRQHVQQPVGRGVLPRIEERPRLRRHDGLGDQHALGPVGRPGRVEHHAGGAGPRGPGLEGDVLVGGTGLVLGDLDVPGRGHERHGQGLLGLVGELCRREQQEGLGMAQDVLQLRRGERWRERYGYCPCCENG